MPTTEVSTPQVEDGHTRLANELLEAMCRAGFSARQWAVVMAVVRKTYGYGKKVDDISLGQLSSMTGIAKPHVSRAVNDLIAAGVLRRSAGTFGNSLSLNKRYKQWALGGAGPTVTDSVTQGLPKEQPGLPEQQPLDGVTETATPVTDSVRVTDSVTQGLPKEQPGLPEQQPLDGVTETATPVTDSVRVTDSVTQGLPKEQPGLPEQQPLDGVTETATPVTDSVRVTDSVTQGLPIREPQKETIQKKEKPLSGKPDAAPHLQAETDAAEAIIAHLNEVTGSAFKPVESNLRLVRGRLGEGYTVEEIRAVIDAKRAEWFGNPRWGKYLRPATLFNATNFAQYAGQLGNVVEPEDGRIDLGNGRYRLNGRIFGADGRPEVVL